MAIISVRHFFCHNFLIQNAFLKPFSLVICIFYAPQDDTNIRHDMAISMVAVKIVLKTHLTIKSNGKKKSRTKIMAIFFVF